MRMIFLSCMLLGLLLAGCRQTPTGSAADAGLRIELAVADAPPSVGQTQLLVKVYDAQGAPITNARVQARGDMSHAGMRPVLAEAAAPEGGQYVLPFEWTMAGDWFVDVTVTLPDGTQAVERFNFGVE